MSLGAAILLPGMDGTGSLFRAVVPALAAAGYDARTVAYPYDRALTFSDYVAVATRAIHDAGPGPVTLVAESFSGPIAIRAATESGDRVGRLVLVASFARAPRGPFVRFARLFGDLPFRRPPGRLAVELAMTGRGAPRALVGEVRAAIGQVAPEVMASRLRILGDVDEREALRRVSGAVTYVRATRDRLVGVASLREVRAARPDARVVEVDAPHLALQVAPDACVEALGSRRGLLLPLR